VVTSVSAKQVVVTFVNADPATITGDGLRFVAAGLRSNAIGRRCDQAGFHVRVVQDAKATGASRNCRSRCIAAQASSHETQTIAVMVAGPH